MGVSATSHEAELSSDFEGVNCRDFDTVTSLVPVRDGDGISVLVWVFEIVESGGSDLDSVRAGEGDMVLEEDFNSEVDFESDDEDDTVRGGLRVSVLRRVSDSDWTTEGVEEEEVLAL